MKKYFLLLAPLALLAAASCDGSPQPEDPSALPDAGSPARPDALAPRTDSPAPGCAVPEPRVKSMWGSTVTTSPRGGFRTLADPVTCSAAYNPPPRDCSRPVDGFSDGTTWCCVSAARAAKGQYQPARPTTMYCFDKVSAGAHTKAPGNVALCSLDGKFVGWDCMDEY